MQGNDSSPMQPANNLPAMNYSILATTNSTVMITQSSPSVSVSPLYSSSRMLEENTKQPSGKHLSAPEINKYVLACISVHYEDE